mgnify:CR=1 FL=1|tara:strand:- start:7 stop:609 length:603 start_codon:yes stop_codon:yes gene_type:complete
MADTYTFGVSHVGQVNALGHSRPTDTNANRIDQRTMVTVHANSLDEAKNKVRNSPEVIRNQQQAARRQNLEGQRQPRLVVNSIIKNPNTPNQQIIKQSAIQKQIAKTLEKDRIKRNVAAIKQNSLPNAQQLYKDGLITYLDKLKLQKQTGSPGVEGQNIKSQPGGARFTTPLGRFTGMKLPPKKLMNQGGIVTNNFKGTF